MTLEDLTRHFGAQILDVLAGRDAFLGARLAARLRLGGGPGDEVWNEAPARVRVENPYFERTPVDLFAAFITDAGVIGPDAVGEVGASREASIGPGVDLLLSMLRRPA